MSRGTFTLIGFVLFAVGLLSLLLNFVGVEFAFLSWLDKSSVSGFLIRISMVVIGAIIMFIARSDFSGERDW